MVLSNIYPIKNQKFYKQEKYIMLLAHIFDLYDPGNFSEDQFIILDNGIYEGAQVSNDLGDIIQMAENSKIPVNEFVIPDTFFDVADTQRKFNENLHYIEEWGHKYSFMYSAHGNSLDDLETQINFLNQFEGLNLTLGIPKKAPYSRQDPRAIELYKKSKFPIHFLGLSDRDPLSELWKVNDIIRSCDTSQLATLILNDGDPTAIMSYVRDENSKIIDIENDFIDEYQLTIGLENIASFDIIEPYDPSTEDEGNYINLGRLEIQELDPNKTYCIHVEVGDVPKEMVQSYMEHLKRMFKTNHIDKFILVPYRKMQIKER